MTCDNCGNNVSVEFAGWAGSFWCMPCREAQDHDDIATFDLRREMLYDGD